LCATVAGLNNDLAKEAEVLAQLIEKASNNHDELEKAKEYAYTVKQQMDKLRSKADALEMYTSDNLWPFPRFWEMLFIS